MTLTEEAIDITAEVLHIYRHGPECQCVYLPEVDMRAATRVVGALQRSGILWRLRGKGSKSYD